MNRPLKKTAPEDIDVIDPAFDITPPELITGIITEKGIAKYPYEESIEKLFEKFYRNEVHL